MKLTYKCLLAITLLLALSILPFPAAAQTTDEEETFELEDTVALAAFRIPVNCSWWHELFPRFCVRHHQAAYGDNGDGVISPCDIIVLKSIFGTVKYHIRWVGPTYYLSDGRVVEPLTLEGAQAGDPVGQVFKEVQPNYGRTFNVTGWRRFATDDDSLDAPQPPVAKDIFKFDDGSEAAVAAVRTNIRAVRIVEPVPVPTATE